MKAFFFGAWAGLLAAAALLRAQPEPQPLGAVRSPVVQADGRVSFFLRAPGAARVNLVREGAAAVPMEKDERGLWSVTVGPLGPDYYAYGFVVDGAGEADPLNPMGKPNLLWPGSLVHVPGPPALAWEVNDVPRGEVSRHFYRSKVVGDNRDFYVYTPPGYAPGGKDRYPVLYLMHGFSDTAEAWTTIGRAEVILDNLIARRQARPMVVVMPLAYGDWHILTRDRPKGLGDPRLNESNYEHFRDTLSEEVMPMVEREYRVRTDAAGTAIAGCSMGGGEALRLGLERTDRFAWIGSFSAGAWPDRLSPAFSTVNRESGGKIRLLWMSCGREDPFLQENRAFQGFLKARGVSFDATEPEGAHAWTLWRRNLIDFSRLLFHP
jgi:enterochelin esterase-like enzyme